MRSIACCRWYRELRGTLRVSFTVSGMVNLQPTGSSCTRYLRSSNSAMATGRIARTFLASPLR